FGLILLAQVPFIYRRYQTGKLADTIERLRSQRVARPDTGYAEYKGVIHVHTSLGGHSTGSFRELIEAANTNDLDFVLITEHYSDVYDTAALTLNGVYGKTLFIGGNEIDTHDSDRFLIIPGSSDAESFRRFPTNSFIEKVHAENRLALVTYPEKFNSWDSNFDGIEIFSLYTAGLQMDRLMTPLDLLWSFPAYPSLTFAQSFKRPELNLRKFDEIASTRKIVLFAGADAHSNLGFHIFGDDSGNKYLNFKLDPYSILLGLARTHVFLKSGETLTRENLLDAVREGHFFTGFDVFGDTSGFSYTAASAAKTSIAGEEIAPANNLVLRATAPYEARFLVYRNGEKFAEERGSEIEVNAPESGVYRVEVYLDTLGSPLDKMPWIISNPIYVR
ncbi:MAG: hypothetical protein ABIO36_00455, partial [Pyrinomonadaceae bacterium]